jgi:hypothetical protein
MRRAARMTRRSRASVAFAGTTNKGATAEYYELDCARFRGGDDKRLVVSQSVETMREYCGPEGPVEFEARFDEFRLDVRLAYRGTPLELPERRPSDQEIVSTEAVTSGLPDMLRRNADRVHASRQDGLAVLSFHFDH